MGAGAVWFASREDIRSALDVPDAARSNRLLDQALRAGTDAVISLCNRGFVPTVATRYFDWPQEQTPRSWRLWLNQYDLITPTLIVSGGVTVPSTDYNLEPANEGPPYTYIETRLDRPSAWSAGGTWQHAIGITGLWGHSDGQATAGALAAAVADTTSTSVTVTDSSAVDVGHMLICGSERMAVTGKALADTGQTVQTPMDAKPSSQALDVTDGTQFHVGEYLTIGAERVEVTGITGNTLIVDRAVRGTALAAHSGSSIWAPRTLTVVRGVHGTTAATAGSGTALTRWDPPALAHELCVAEAENWLLQRQSGWLRTIGSGERGGKEATLEALKDLRVACQTAHGRQIRQRAV